MFLHFSNDEEKEFIVSESLNPFELSKIKSSAKANGATVNDIILAAYAGVLERKLSIAHIELPCPVDLRKYQKSDNLSICNLTANYSLSA